MAADASVEAKIETDGQQKKVFSVIFGMEEKEEREKTKKVSPDKIFFSRQRC